jgi:hypothetical protein
MATKATQAKSVGLFPVGFQIGGNKPGAVTFDVHFVVSTPTRALHGAGRLTQSINPPLDLPTILTGEYTFMTVMPDQSKILVTAVGHGPLSPIQPLEATNVRLRMVLSKDWQSGVANYDYFSDDKWNSVENAPVKFIAAAIPQQDV